LEGGSPVVTGSNVTSYICKHGGKPAKYSAKIASELINIQTEYFLRITGFLDFIHRPVF
jgi:hypothetical protein